VTSPAQRWRAPLATIATLGAYALAVAGITWPLASVMSTHLTATALGSQCDQHHAIWALAWESHALATAPSTFLDANIYWPAKHALLYAAASFGSLPYFAPVFLTTGNPALSMNVVFLLGVTLTAAALHLVVVRWTGSYLAGAIAGATFVCTRWVLWEWLPAAPQYAILVYVPFIVGLAARPQLDTRGTLALAALVALQSLTDLVYVAPAVFAPLGVVAAARLVRPTTRREGARLLGALALALLPLAPLCLGLLWVKWENPDLAAQSVWKPIFAATPISRALFGRLVAVAVPIVTLVLVAAGAVSRARRPRDDDAVRARAWACALTFATVGTCLALPYNATWWGHELTNPLYRFVPALTVIRVPARLGSGGLVGFCLLAGLAFFELARRVREWLSSRGAAAVSIVLAVLVCWIMDVDLRPRPWSPVAQWELPDAFPVLPSPASDSPIIAAIRARAGPLLEVPVDKFRGADPTAHAVAMYRSIFHWRPLLNGYSSYWPHGFLERMQIVQRLPEPDAIEALWRETGLGLLLVHTASMRERARAWLALATGLHAWLRPVARDRGDVLFEVTPPPGTAPRVDPPAA